MQTINELLAIRSAIEKNKQRLENINLDAIGHNLLWLGWTVAELNTSIRYLSSLIERVKKRTQSGQLEGDDKLPQAPS